MLSVSITGRCVMVATFYTLFFVPTAYTVLKREPPKDFDREDEK